MRAACAKSVARLIHQLPSNREVGVVVFLHVEQKPDFITRVAQLEDSLQEHLPDSMPRKRTPHVSNNAPTQKFYLTKNQPTQFWRFWKAFLLGRQ
jgi:hypothetical protein